MITFFKNFFLNNWKRKLLAIVLAIITWFFVNHSLSATKTLSHIHVKFSNLAANKAVISKIDDITLTLTGNKKTLDNIESTDLEIVIDAKNKLDDFSFLITKSSLVSKNAHLKIEKDIQKVDPIKLSVSLSNLITEKIPVLFLKPTGNAPKGYELLDIWPVQLFVTISGPEEEVNKLKITGILKRFNLDDISQEELNAINSSMQRGKNNVVSYFIPTSWKKVFISSISNIPIDIDDPNANSLRIDFKKNDFLPLKVNIPIVLYFPSSVLSKYNPQNTVIKLDENVISKNGMYFLNKKIYAQGVNEKFIDIIKDHVEILICIEDKNNNEPLDWNLNYVNPKKLQTRFVEETLKDTTNDILKKMPLDSSEEYLKDRFRKLVKDNILFLSKNQKLKLIIKLINNEIIITQDNS